jgi:hypothetical protein
MCIVVITAVAAKIAINSLHSNTFYTILKTTSFFVNSFRVFQNIPDAS